jgi:D-alanyl-D-alanine carboxypeptidase (penicillin-binding protein 5/6)
MKTPPILIAFLLFAAALFAAEPPAISARSAILFDANSGKVLFKQNADEQRPVASTQKLLTALIVAESGSLSDMVTIKETDTNVEPTKLYAKPGQQYSRDQLLHALLIKSCNDIARALARDNAGSIPEFAARMNANMRRLGGSDSNFVNPNGLPAEGQYSSARDMARVARAAYKNPTLREIMNTKYYDFRFSNGKILTLKNTNRVLRHYSFCNGMKTGYTEKARHCLISSGSYNGRDVIAVVLGSTKGRVWDESCSLLAYGLGISPSSIEKFRIGGAE